MRQDKALLNFDGAGLLQKQFDRLEGLLGKGRVLVSGDRPRFPHVTDISAGLGPLEGLRSVCVHLSRREGRVSILVVPVDMPLMTVDGLKRLIGHSGAHDAVKFSGHQLPAVFHDAGKTLLAIEDLMGELGGRLLSFNTLFSRISVEEIPPETDAFFTNLNTPEDLDAALSPANHSS